MSNSKISGKKLVEISSFIGVDTRIIERDLDKYAEKQQQQKEIRENRKETKLGDFVFLGIPVLKRHEKPTYNKNPSELATLEEAIEEYEFCEKNDLGGLDELNKRMNELLAERISILTDFDSIWGLIEKCPDHHLFDGSFVGATYYNIPAITAASMLAKNLENAAKVEKFCRYARGTFSIELSIKDETKTRLEDIFKEEIEKIDKNCPTTIDRIKSLEKIDKIIDDKSPVKEPLQNYLKEAYLCEIKTGSVDGWKHVYLACQSDKELLLIGLQALQKIASFRPKTKV